MDRSPILLWVVLMGVTVMQDVVGVGYTVTCSASSTCGFLEFCYRSTLLCERHEGQGSLVWNEQFDALVGRWISTVAMCLGSASTWIAGCVMVSCGRDAGVSVVISASTAT